MPWYMLALLYAIFLTFCIDLSELCSCQLMHPQEAFCKSDFVILARVKQYQIFNETIAYKVRIRKHFKMSEKAEIALKSGRLLTAKETSLCRASLIPGKIYVLFGRVIHLKAYTTMCDVNYRWEDLSRRQRKGLKMMYRQGCVCKIASCYSSLSCQKKRGTCTFSTMKSECYNREGICLLSPSKVCRWAKSAQLNKCVGDKKLTMSRWSG